MDKTQGKEFIKKYESFDSQSTDDLIDRYSSTQEELHETISFLIRHRELLKQSELEQLTFEISNLLKKVDRLKVEKLLTEIYYFKEMLALQRKLVEYDKQGRRGKTSQDSCS